MPMLLRMTESCLLVAMGSFMAVLAQSSIYWQFINPRFSTVTLVSGVALIAIGFATLFDTHRRRTMGQCLGFLVFLGLAATAVFQFDSMGMASAPLEGETGLSMEYAGEDTADVVFDGVSYVKINVAELLNAEGEGEVTPGQAYAVQGAVIRSPELDRAGCIGVGRLLITCCFADSSGVVALVKVDDPDTHAAGSWVRVLGTIEQGVPFAGDTITLSGALTGVKSEQFVIRAVAVEERAVEGVPFIFEIRSEAPYAF